MSSFVDNLDAVFARFGPIESRRMFGGHGIYHDGRMFALVASDRLYLKTDDLDRLNFEALGLPAFEFTQRDRRVQTSYREAPAVIFEDPNEAALWARRAFEAALRSGSKTPTPAARQSQPPRTPLPPLPLPPDREQIAALPLFDGLGPQSIERVASAGEAERAFAAVQREQVVGFDTESKPTFVKNEVSAGPHTVQFASLDRAWVFQLHDAACRDAAAQLIASTQLLKVGFGLATDRCQILAKLGVELRNVLDLDTVFRRRGYRQSIGVKTAVALVFEQRFVKSRKQTTSNWASRSLTEAQLRYAANDAYAAMRVFDALGDEARQ